MKVSKDSEHGKEWLIGVLKNSTANIEFTKADGTIRLMQSTLQPELLPKIVIAETADIKEFKEPKKQNPDLLVVFDVEKQAWRSVKWSTIISINFEV